MLDSKLIKKYFKSGLWNKILLAAFLVFLIVGAVVGYFLHNNNIYAQETSSKTLSFSAGEINGDTGYGGGFKFGDKFKEFRVGNNTVDLKSVGKSFKTTMNISETDLKNFKLVPRDGLDLEICRLTCNGGATEPKGTEGDDRYTFDLSYYADWNTLNITISIDEYKTITLKPLDDLQKYVSKISFVQSKGHNTISSYPRHITTKTDVTDKNKYGSYRVITGSRLWIGFELNNVGGTVTCDVNDGENDGGYYGGKYYECDIIRVERDMTVNVDISVSGKVDISLGAINDHSGGEIDLPLGMFVSDIDVNYVKGKAAEKEKDLGEWTLGENDKNKKVDVALGNWYVESRKNRFKITPRDSEKFTVSSLTYIDSNNEVQTAKLTDGYFEVKIGRKIPSEIRVNLSGVDYAELKDFNYENSNFDIKDDDVFNKGECKAYTGYDVLKINNEWKVARGHVDVILNDDYTVLRNSSATYTEGGTTISTSPIYVKDKDDNSACSTGTGDMGQRLMVTFEGNSIQEGGKISLMVVGKDTVFEVTFGSNTGFKAADAVESITLDGRQTDLVGDNYTTNASYIKNSVTSSNYSIEIKFVDGYTLNHYKQDGTDDISQIMSFTIDKGGCTAAVSNVEESLSTDGNYVCKLNMSIYESDSADPNERLESLTANLNLVLRDYTVKFVQVDDNGKSLDYDPSVFWISKYTGSQEVNDSYETKKDYLKFSSSVKKFEFNLTLGKNYIDCIDGLTYTSDDSNVTVKPVEVSNTDKSETPATVNTDGTATKKLTLSGTPVGNNITITIKNLKPNTIYVPISIERDSVLEKYGIEATATISPESSGKKEIPSGSGKWYDSRAAVGDDLKYDLSAGTDYTEKFQNWAKSQSSGVLFTNVFFDVSQASVDKNNGAYVDIKDLDTDATEWVTVGTEKFRVVKDTKLKGPDVINPKVNFKLNSRYREFLDIIKVVKNDDDSWGTGETLTWQDTAVDEITATATFEAHPFVEKDIKEYVAIKSHSDADLRDILSEMIVQEVTTNSTSDDTSTSTKGLTLNSNVSNTEVDAFPEEKYKILGVNFSGTNLDKDRTGRDNSYNYNYRLLNIKYPRHSAQVDVAGENMATLGITSGFLVDSWKTVTEGEGENQKSFLSASYNYNSTIAFTVQAGPNYTISDIENEIKIFNTEQENGIDGTEGKVSYTYTEYQNEKNETVLEIIVNNVKSNLYIYVDFGPKHKTITHTKIEGANSYRIEKDDAGYHCREMILGRNTVPDGSPYYFMVEAQTGYNIGSLEMSSTDTEAGLKEITSEASIIYDQGNERSSKIRVYKIESVKKNQTISGTIVKDQCSVTFNLDKNYPEALSYKYEGQVLDRSKGINVDYGENIEFSTQIKEKYNRSNYKIMLYEKGSEENGRELNLVNGVYNISNIVGDKDVRVEGIEINKYSINLVKNDAAEYLNSNQDEIYGVQTVEYDGSYEFTLKANTGYSIGDTTQVICTSEDGTKKTLNPDKSGKYKLSNVKGDFTINIMNVDDIYYTVTFIPVEGVTYVNDKDAVVTGSFQIKHGSNFEFGVNVDDAYDDSKAGMYIVINDGKSQNLRSQILYSGRYTINNITEDAEIKVGNIRKNTYTVTLNKVEGMDFYNDSNKIISGDNTVSHGDSLSFKVNLYPAYADSKVKIMLGTQELSADESGFYTVKNVIENKIVTVNGVEETVESKFTNTINNLPDNVNSLSDVDDVISASRVYESLTDEQKARVGNIDKLKRLQEQVKKYHHVSNGITIEGVDWNIKLFAIPIDNSMEVYTRLYKKLNSEYILSLYNVYLWDTIQDVKYTLPEGQSAVISLPTPEMTYFERPTGIHEKDNGKLDYLSLILGNDQVTFTTDSFSPMGVVANRTSTPGRSSLLDTWDANVQAIKDYALSNANSGNSKNENSASSSEYVSDNDSSEDNDGNTGNINDKFKSRNNPVTPRGSAIRLLLVLLILILLSIIIIIIIENMKKIKEDKDGKK